jgi:hypothetical protein
MRMQRQEAAQREVERYSMDPSIQDDIKQVRHQCSLDLISDVTYHRKLHGYEDKSRDKTKQLKCSFFILLFLFYNKRFVKLLCPCILVCHL